MLFFSSPIFSLDSSRVWGLIWCCQDSSFHDGHIKESGGESVLLCVHYSNGQTCISWFGFYILSASVADVSLCEAGGIGDEFLVSLMTASSKKLQCLWKGTKRWDAVQRKWNMQTSHCGFFWQERSDLFHREQHPTLFPQLHLWCCVLDLYINSWDNLALIKIHKQVQVHLQFTAKCLIDFLCSCKSRRIQSCGLSGPAHWFTNRLLFQEILLRTVSGAAKHFMSQCVLSLSHYLEGYATTYLDYLTCPLKPWSLASVWQ